MEAGLHAKATIVFQEYCCEKTTKYLREKGQEVVVMNAPCGVAGTDRFLMDETRLMETTKELDAALVDPLKTTLVQRQRAMTTWVLRKAQAGNG